MDPEIDPGDLPRDLIARARAGSTGAFEQIYRTFAGRVYGVCLRVLCDPSRAEDVTQQVFIKLWRKLDSFRGKGGFGSWIHRMAVNAAIDELRVSESTEDRNIFWNELQAGSASRSDDLRDMQLDLEKALAALPPGMRVVFVLHEIEGFSHEDIAGRLGVTEGTSKTQLFRARRLLREALEEQ